MAKKNKKEAVVGGKAKKKGFFGKIAEYYFPEDISNIPEYITYQFFVPAVFDAICDSLTNGVEMIFHGNGKGSKKRKFDDPLGYNKISSKGGKMKISDGDERVLGVDIFIPGTIKDVDYFLSVLDKDIDDYTWISVADVYERAGIKMNYVRQEKANRYGWTSVEDVTYRSSWDKDSDGDRVKGYTLHFPKPTIQE